MTRAATGLPAAVARAVTAAACALGVAVPVTVLLGWVLRIDRLKHLISTPTPMNPTTAVGFLLCAFTLWGRRRPEPGRLPRGLTSLSALLAIAIGALLILGYLGDWRTRVDTVLFGGQLAGNRMAPNAALNFILIGAALLGLDWAPRRHLWPTFYLVVCAFGVALLATTGYAYRTLSFYQVGGYNPMALHTALLFVALCLGTLCARPERGPLAMLGSKSPGGVLARRLLPASLLIPLGLGWLRLAGQARGLYDTELGASLLVLLSMGLFTFLIWWNAQSLHQLDGVRRESEALLLDKNRQLDEAAHATRRAHEALKEAQSQMVQNEKMASLGQLVAGVAHEINNPLSFVSNNLAVLARDVQSLRGLIELYREGDDLLARERAPLFARIREQDEAIDLTYTLSNLDDLLLRSREGLRRIQQIVKDLRDFARLDESDRQEVDLNQGIESTLHIVRGLAKKRDVRVDAELNPLPRILCYPAKINQVIMNLLVNGIDACAAGGVVTLRTSAAEREARVEVEDTGKGIDPAIIERIFDPFFTTKPPGQGTGLGLSISHGIVREHGGTLEVESQQGRGARFLLRLPI